MNLGATARATLAAAALVATAARATAARAEAPKVRGARLAWARGVGAEACVGPLGLEESVKAILGADPFARPPEVDIEGVVVRDGRGLRTDLWLRDRDGRTLGKRSVRSGAPDCAELGRAAATIVAVMIDPDLEEPRPGADDADTPPPAPPAPDARGRRVPFVPAPPSLAGSVLAGATAGLVPGPSDVYALRGELAVGRWVGVGVGASWLRPIPEGDFAFGLTTAEARACLTPWGARGVARLCGALLVGAFDASLRRTTLRPVEVGAFPWAGAELGPAIAVPLAGPVALAAGVSAIVPITRRQGFVGGAAEPVWEQSPIGGRAELGLTFRP